MLIQTKNGMECQWEMLEMRQFPNPHPDVIDMHVEMVLNQAPHHIFHMIHSNEIHVLNQPLAERPNHDYDILDILKGFSKQKCTLTLFSIGKTIKFIAGKLKIIRKYIRELTVLTKSSTPIANNLCANKRKYLKRDANFTKLKFPWRLSI